MEDARIIFNLKELREAEDISQTQLAEKLGLSRQSIIAFERGRFLPSLQVAINLCDFFNKEFSEIFDTGHNTELSNSSAKSNNVGVNIFNKEKETAMSSILEPWRPFRDSLSLREAMDRLMEDSIVSPRSAMGMAPKINVINKEKTIVVKIEVPEVNEEDLDIEVADDLITVSGERREEKETKEEDYFHKETHYGTFSRSVSLPSAVVADKAEAEVKNGILTVTIPKVEEKKAKKVHIKTSK
jgi:HSP20 family protein